MPTCKGRRTRSTGCFPGGTRCSSNFRCNCKQWSLYVARTRSRSTSTCVRTRRSRTGPSRSQTRSTNVSSSPPRICSALAQNVSRRTWSCPDQAHNTNALRVLPPFLPRHLPRHVRLWVVMSLSTLRCSITELLLGGTLLQD